MTSFIFVTSYDTRSDSEVSLDFKFWDKDSKDYKSYYTPYIAKNLADIFVNKCRQSDTYLKAKETFDWISQRGAVTEDTGEMGYTDEFIQQIRDMKVSQIVGIYDK